MYTLDILGPKRVFPREFKSLIERCLEIFVHKNVYIKIVAHLKKKGIIWLNSIKKKSLH